MPKATRVVSGEARIEQSGSQAHRYDHQASLRLNICDSHAVVTGSSLSSISPLLGLRGFVGPPVPPSLLGATPSGLIRSGCLSQPLNQCVLASHWASAASLQWLSTPHQDTHTDTHIHKHTCAHTNALALSHVDTYSYTHPLTLLHTYMHLHTHTHSLSHTDAHTFTNRHICTHMYTHCYTHMHTHIHCLRHRYTYTYTHLHSHTYTNTHTYSRIHTQTLALQTDKITYSFCKPLTFLLGQPCPYT